MIRLLQRRSSHQTGGASPGRPPRFCRKGPTQPGWQRAGRGVVGARHRTREAQPAVSAAVNVRGLRALLAAWTLPAGASRRSFGLSTQASCEPCSRLWEIDPARSPWRRMRSSRRWLVGTGLSHTTGRLVGFGVWRSAMACERPSGSVAMLRLPMPPPAQILRTLGSLSTQRCDRFHLGRGRRLCCITWLAGRSRRSPRCWGVRRRLFVSTYTEVVLRWRPC